MPNPLWLDRVRRVLLRAGIPPGYAARLLEELGDHAAELAEHLPAAAVAERLGDPDAVARDAVRAYRAGRFTGRHPVLAFLVAPLFGAVLAWQLYIAAGIELVEGVGGMESAFAVGLSHVLTRLSGFVVPAAVVTAVWRMYRVSGRPRAWFAAGGVVVAALAGLYFAEFTPPTANAEADLVTEFRFAGSWVQFLQFAAVAGLAVRLAAGAAPRPHSPAVAC